MNCCIKLVNWPSPQSVHHHASFFFVCWWKKTFLSACVWHMCLVMCSNTRKAQSKTLLCIANKNTACQFRYGVGKLKGGGRGAGLCQLSAMSEPISTNRLCQLRDGTWGSVVVLKYRSMSGVKVPGRCCEGEDGGGWRGGKRIGEARI